MGNSPSPAPLAPFRFFADSVDFLEDASVNLLIAVALNWPPKWRARTGIVLAAIMILPAIALVWTAWRKFQAPVAPEASLLSVTGFAALAVNSTCAFILAKVRRHKGSLMKAAFLSARNEAIANVAIIAAGIVTVFWGTAWPDLVVGVGIAAIILEQRKRSWKRRWASTTPLMCE